MSVNDSGKLKFNLANDLVEEDDYENAILIYKELLASNEYDVFSILIQLGGAYYFQKKYPEAYDTYRRALNYNPNSEISSLGFYLACVGLDNLQEGILEMRRYLETNTPNLYKDTIDELVEGLENGYATDFRDIILEFKKLK